LFVQNLALLIRGCELLCVSASGNDDVVTFSLLMT